MIGIKNKPNIPVDSKDLTVSHKGYGITKANKEIYEWLKDTLTVTPKVNMAVSNEEPEPFTIYKENSTKIYIPITLGFRLFGTPSKYELSEGEYCERLIFNGKLRPEQVIPTSAFLTASKHPEIGQRGGIISLQCAAGKTVMALYIISQIKRKTIIVCHKDFLINQWRERIAEFIPTAKVGLIKAKTVNTDADIILASLQSISMKDYPIDTFKGIHLLTVDECHHLGAAVFSKALSKIAVPIVLGLSATLDRKDGLRKVFEWHIGAPVITNNTKRDDTDMIIQMIDYYNPHPDCSRELTLWNNKPNMVRMVSNLVAFEPRTKTMIDALIDLLEKEPDRKTLIISHRVNHLKLIEIELLDRKLDKTIGYYIGGMRDNDRKKSEECDIMLGTFNMISEGFDVPQLNTLVLATPVASVEQCIGRVQRQKKCDRKYTPYVIDIWDTFSMFKNQGFRRINFYKKCGYTVIGDVPSEEPEQSGKKKLVFLPDSDEED